MNWKILKKANGDKYVGWVLHYHEEHDGDSLYKILTKYLPHAYLEDISVSKYCSTNGDVYYKIYKVTRNIFGWAKYIPIDEGILFSKNYISLLDVCVRLVEYRNDEFKLGLFERKELYTAIQYQLDEIYKYDESFGIDWKKFKNFLFKRSDQINAEDMLATDNLDDAEIKWPEPNDALKNARVNYEKFKEENNISGTDDPAVDQLVEAKTKLATEDFNKGTTLYNALTYAAVATFHIYSLEVKWFNAIGEPFTTADPIDTQNFRKHNPELVQRVFEETLNVLNYELSDLQMSKAIAVFIKSTFKPSSVFNTEVYQPKQIEA